MRVPLGVVAIVYEARPNVTVDAAALAIKSGNAVVLRGSSMAQRSNAVLARGRGRGRRGCRAAGGLGLAAPGGDRADLLELVRQEGLVDLVIPRGGEGLKKVLKENATVPVIYAAAGNCHVYVDASADPEMARRIAFNAKVQRPGVCNASETLLVHARRRRGGCPGAARRPARGGRRAARGPRRARGSRATAPRALADATEEDWATEYLGLKMAVKVVDSLEEAIDHVNRYGTGSLRGDRDRATTRAATRSRAGSTRPAST